MNTFLYFRGGTEDAAVLRLEDCAIFAEDDAIVLLRLELISKLFQLLVLMELQLLYFYY